MLWRPCWLIPAQMKLNQAFVYLIMINILANNHKLILNTAYKVVTVGHSNNYVHNEYHKPDDKTATGQFKQIELYSNRFSPTSLCLISFLCSCFSWNGTMFSRQSLVGAVNHEKGHNLGSVLWRAQCTQQSAWDLRGQKEKKKSILLFCIIFFDMLCFVQFLSVNALQCTKTDAMHFSPWLYLFILYFLFPPCCFKMFTEIETKGVS